MLQRVLLVACVLTSPLLLGVSLLLLNSINGMLLVFLTEVRVHNATAETLLVTPIGTTSAGEKYGLPIYATRLPALPSFRTGGFLVRAGEVRSIIYDADDARLSELIVRRAAISNESFVVGRDQAIDSAGRDYRIVDLKGMPTAEPETDRVAREVQWDWGLVRMPAVGIVPLMLFVAYRREAARRLRVRGRAPA